MSNGNGVTATLSDAAESVKEKAAEIGDAFAQLVQGDHQRWGQVLTAMGGLQLD